MARSFAHFNYFMIRTILFTKNVQDNSPYFHLDSPSVRDKIVAIIMGRCPFSTSEVKNIEAFGGGGGGGGV